MFLQRLVELNKVIKETRCTLDNQIIDLDQALAKAKQLLGESRGIAYVIGNGGSAGIASHFCTDLMKALKIASSTLYDSNLLTCLSNDLGYEYCFSYQLNSLLSEKDLLIAISSSGASKNIINAVKVAKKKNVKVITLSGFSEANPLRKLGDLNFWSNISDYGLVETSHFFILHTLVDLYHKIPCLKREKELMHA